MRTRRMTKKPVFTLLALLALAFAAPVAHRAVEAETRAKAQELTVAADFAAKASVAPNEQIGLTINRPLSPAEGRLAVLIGHTDATNLFAATPDGLSYTPKLFSLPAGESQVTVYLVSPGDEWRQVAQFPLRVADQQGATQPQSDSRSALPPAVEAVARRFVLTPALTLGFKSQAAETHFPETNRPERPIFTDFTMQGSLKTEAKRGWFNMQNQFDVAGSSHQNEALRFGQLGNAAPQVDLSSYLMQFQLGKTNFQAGHISYGSNRLLMNSYSSRGLMFTVPMGKRADFSVSAMNGTSIVGWGNFLGLNRRKHQIVSGTLGFEFLPQRKGGLRVEAGAMSGSLLPLAGFNQGALTDVERSRGGSLRLLASDKSQRLRLEAGFARSGFTNPRDPLLEQNAPVLAVRETTRKAHYLDASYDILRDLKLNQTKTAKLTLNFKHERADPLYRSAAAFVQADRMQNQIELAGNIGDFTLAASHLRFEDNLADIPSILKTNTRRDNLIIGAPLAPMLSKPDRHATWLPRLSYNFDRTHQLGRGLPVNSDFNSLSQIPDQVSVNQTLNAEWQFQKWRMSYRFNHSAQDNRQIGRERADLRNLINAFSFGLTTSSAFDLNLELNAESAKNFEMNRTDRLWRLGPNFNWRMTPKTVLALTVSSAFAGDVEGASRSRNAEVDLQWSYQFGYGENGWKKLRGNYFIRYANRYARTFDQVFGLNNLTKLQTLNTGLNITFF